MNKNQIISFSSQYNNNLNNESNLKNINNDGKIYIFLLLKK